MLDESTGFKYRILVVDDEPAILETSALMLGSNGYEARTAIDGFAALRELRRSLPDLVISDLSMPNMTGFELLSILRRRFPHIPVIAISGHYGENSPSGLIADSFFRKCGYDHEQLLSKIQDLLERAPIRPNIARPDQAPVWTPKSTSGYVVTCPECLRSFSVEDNNGAEYREVECVYCGARVTYLADLSALRRK